MSVLVKGMKMPESCIDCEIKQYDDYEDDCVCPFSGVVCLSIGRQDACPLVALPDHHGRLVDADALEKEGWSLHRTIRVDKNTEEYQTKPLRKVPTIEPRCETCEAFNKTRLLIPQPQRKKGHWIRHPEQRNIFNGKTIECSECHEKYTVQYVEDELFCRHCGADMREPEDIPMEYFESGGR